LLTILSVFKALCQDHAFFLITTTKKHPNTGKIDNIIVYLRLCKAQVSRLAVRYKNDCCILVERQVDTAYVCRICAVRIIRL
jgi:hypothetical protein